MSKIQYVSKKLSGSSLLIVEQANDIIDEYQQQGFDLTLRQLYYQFVSRDLIANKQTEYKRLGSIINDGRMAGLIDWDAIVDRTRNLASLATWESPAEIVEACAAQFRIDKWATQDFRLEVWIEKDALVGVIEGVCREFNVPYFSCRGYTSQSEMWAASQRLLKHCENEQAVHIIHLGDHDPSGIDMSRDIEDRLHLFMEHSGYEFTGALNRIALNMDQVKKYGPPPNPAKLSDSRSDVYVEKFGDESWELDALDPKVLADLIRAAIKDKLDPELWEESCEQELHHRLRLKKAAASLEID